MIRRDICSIYVLMNQGTCEHLRAILSVALALVPKRIRKDWIERVTAKTEPAKAEIVNGLIAAIDQHFDVERKPDVPPGLPLGSKIPIPRKRPHRSRRSGVFGLLFFTPQTLTFPLADRTN